MGDALVSVQLLPGTFEHAMNYLIDRKLDLSGFDVRFKNDVTALLLIRPRCC